MPQPLESARLKIGRAEEHIRGLNEHYERFRKTNPYRVTRHLEQDGAEHVYSVEIMREPPPYLGTIVGDFFHNLRSALDSMIYDLSRPAIPRLTKHQVRGICFPIALCDEHYNPRGIEWICEVAQAEVECAQPYNRRDLGHLHPLWVIHEGNRFDKHRFVHLVAAVSSGAFFGAPPVEPIREGHHPLGAFENHAELARFTFGEPQPDVDMNFTPMLGVALPDRDVLAEIDMRQMVNHVRDEVLPRFERFF